MKAMPITRSGTERSTSSSRRTGCWIHTGETLRAAASPSGMAISMASTVPQSAICTVSHIWTT